MHAPFHHLQATQISPWVVSLDALEPHAMQAPPQDPSVLAYLGGEAEGSGSRGTEDQRDASGEKDDSLGRASTAAAAGGGSKGKGYRVGRMLHDVHLSVAVSPAGGRHPTSQQGTTRHGWEALVCSSNLKYL